MINVLASMPVEKQEQHIAVWGKFHEAPPNWRVIDADEFARRSCTYTPDAVEYRQIRDPATRMGPIIAAHLMFFWDKTGVAHASVHDFRTGKWVAQFFAFGCAHAYRDMTPDERAARSIRLGNCEHASICTKCGHVYTYDSSD